MLTKSRNSKTIKYPKRTINLPQESGLTQIFFREIPNVVANKNFFKKLSKCISIILIWLRDADGIDVLSSESTGGYWKTSQLQRHLI